MSSDTSDERSKEDVVQQRLVRFVYPGHRYHNQIGEIIEGDIECCILRFHDIGRDFGPCFRDRQGKLEPVSKANAEVRHGEPDASN